MQTSPRLIRICYFLALVNFILPFVLQNRFYQLHRDEYLYLAEGKHLAWGFMEVPPAMSILAWITNSLGAGFFWVKLWPALFGALSFLLVGRMVISLGGKVFAILLAWLPFILDGYLRLFFLFHPNFLDVFFWTLMAFSLFNHTQTQKVKWLYMFGVAAGIGMMCKYSVAFYAVSLLGAILLTRERKIFFSRHFYFACIIGFLIFLPNLLWQYNHRWPVIHHMQELQDEQLKYNSAIDFIISQLLMNAPCVFVWLAGLVYVFKSQQNRSFALFGWAYVFVIVLLIALRGKDYYALGSYPVLFSFGAFYLERATEGRGKRWRYAMMCFAILIGLFIFPLVFAVARPNTLVSYYKATGLNKTGFFKWEDQRFHPLPQDFGDMMGWRELAQKAGAVYNTLPADERNKTLVYCRAYYSAGALNYYRKLANLPEVYSDNASFLFWMPDTYNVKNLILIAHHIPDTDDIVFQQFQKMSIKDSIDMPMFRETGMRIILYEKGNDSLNRLIQKGIADQKKRYTR